MERNEITLARMAAYSALSQCYYYPREDLRVLFENSEFLEQKILLKMVDVDLTFLVSQYKAIKDDRFTSLQKEYTRLFVTSMGSKIPAPPYGSIYLDSGKCIWGESTREVVKLYAQAGLRISEDFKDLPDHFAAELEFMFYLLREQMRLNTEAEEENEAVTNDEDLIDIDALINIEKNFLMEHLLKWGFLMLQNVKEASSHQFYHALAEVTDSFLSFEKNRIKKQETS